jgi:hypothetical protein
MQELIPILSGLIIGSLLGFVRPGRRLPLGLALAILFGAFATFGSGEFQVSKLFFLVDIALVALSAAIALGVLHYLRWARRAER